MNPERVDTLLVAAGIVLTLGLGAFVGRVGWLLAGRAVDWIATHRPLRERRAVADTIPAPPSLTAISTLAADRGAALADALLTVRVARHALLGAALRGDRPGAARARAAIDTHSRLVVAIARAEAEEREVRR